MEYTNTSHTLTSYELNAVRQRPLGAWNTSASFCRCAIQLTRTRQFLPWANAAVTSVMT